MGLRHVQQRAGQPTAVEETVGEGQPVAVVLGVAQMGRAAARPGKVQHHPADVHTDDFAPRPHCLGQPSGDHPRAAAEIQQPFAGNRGQSRHQPGVGLALIRDSGPLIDKPGQADGLVGGQRIGVGPGIGHHFFRFAVGTGCQA